MSNTIETLLGGILGMLFIILIYVRWIYLKFAYDKGFDPEAPVNQYGESFTDAIQNSIARGQRGLSTYE